jgi:hypothetical protein
VRQRIPNERPSIPHRFLSSTNRAQAERATVVFTLSERVSRRALLCSFFFKNGLEQPRQSAPHDIGPQLAASDRFSELPVFYRTGVMIMS